MIDIKMLKLGLEQLSEEKKLPFDKVQNAIERSLAAAYQKEYGKKGQVIKCSVNFDTGEMDFEQVKTVVDENTVRILTEEEGAAEDKMNREQRANHEMKSAAEGEELLPRYNEEKHIMIGTAKLFKKNVELGEEVIFPLESKDDFGRIAAQTAKQVIVQALREAERESVAEEFSDRANSIVVGTVQRVERGIVFVDLGRATAIMPPEEQIMGERYNPGARVRAYLYNMENDTRGLSLRLSRTHPKFLVELFKLESSEIAEGLVEILSVAREPGSRSKISVRANDDRIDPIGACVGQRGTRVNAITTELHGEKIDIIEHSDDVASFITKSLSPAQPISIELKEEENKAVVVVSEDQQSLAIGKGGQNVRLAAKLTGWKIDIVSDRGVDLDEEDPYSEGIDSEVAEIEKSLVKNEKELPNPEKLETMDENN